MHRLFDPRIFHVNQKGQGSQEVLGDSVSDFLKLFSKIWKLGELLEKDRVYQGKSA